MPVINNVQNQQNTPALWSGLFSSFPAPGFTGRLLVATNLFAWYRDNGSSFDLIGGPGTGTITGSGTPGNIVKFTGTSIIGNSIITESGAALNIAGTVSASSFIKAGGTSAQFLKADGSVDNTSYIPVGGAVTSITGTADQVNASSATGAVILSLPQSIATTSSVTFYELSLSYVGSSLRFQQDLTDYYLSGPGNGGAIRIRSNIVNPVNRDLQLGFIDNTFNFTPTMMLANITGEATFISTVTSTRFITTGGTVAQYVTGTGSLVTFPTNVSSFTNDAGYVTASSVSNFTNKTGAISQWTNDAGYVTASSVSNFTNKTGAISQWTNDAGYVTASSVSNFTNKTGAISQWTNDAGYITSASIAGFVPYTGANTTVDLNTQSLLSGPATFTVSSGSFGAKVIGGDQSYARYVVSNTGTGGHAFSFVAGFPNTDNTGMSIHDDTNNATVARIDNSGNFLVANSLTIGSVVGTGSGNFFSNMGTFASRVNINGATDNVNFALNVSGCTYTNSFSPTATQFATAQTIDANTTYIFIGGVGITFTMGNPGLTNKLFFVKNFSVNTLTIAGFGGSANIIDKTNTAQSSISLLTGQTIILQQDGGSKTFILSIF